MGMILCRSECGVGLMWGRSDVGQVEIRVGLM